MGHWSFFTRLSGDHYVLRATQGILGTFGATAVTPGPQGTVSSVVMKMK